MLFNEPKLLKLCCAHCIRHIVGSFSALQRAEIAEIRNLLYMRDALERFSALQRAEIAEICGAVCGARLIQIVSVLFNEPKLLKFGGDPEYCDPVIVSVLFNEPKLLKSTSASIAAWTNCAGFSALQRAEIAEISTRRNVAAVMLWFQCSSTSRNC